MPGYAKEGDEPQSEQGKKRKGQNYAAGHRGLAPLQAGLFKNGSKRELEHGHDGLQNAPAESGVAIANPSA